MMWLGTGEVSKIALLAYATVFVVALNTMAGVAAIPRNQVPGGALLRCDAVADISARDLPATLDYMVAGMRLAMVTAFRPWSPPSWSLRIPASAS